MSAEPEVEMKLPRKDPWRTLVSNGMDPLDKYWEQASQKNTAKGLHLESHP